MSTSTDLAVDSIVTLRPEPDGHEIPTLEPIQSEPEPAAIAATTPEHPVAARRARPWLVPVAIGVAGVIAAGTLGGFLVSTMGQRDAARGQLATTRSTLVSTRAQLSAAKADAATRKVSSDYVSLVAVDGGKAVADYASIAACNAFGECRTAAQQTLTDLQDFRPSGPPRRCPPTWRTPTVRSAMR